MIGYEKQLGSFLRARRGNQPLETFAKKIGISTSSLQRLEVGEQNVTLKTLRTITARLGCSIRDIFPEG